MLNYRRIFLFKFCIRGGVGELALLMMYKNVDNNSGFNITYDWLLHRRHVSQFIWLMRETTSYKI